jgi:hypothetical protein
MRSCQHLDSYSCAIDSGTGETSVKTFMTELEDANSSRTLMQTQTNAFVMIADSATELFKIASGIARHRAFMLN